MLTLLQQFFGTELVNEVDELQRNSLLQVSYLLALCSSYYVYTSVYV